jgi:hypothetical protein
MEGRTDLSVDVRTLCGHPILSQVVSRLHVQLVQYSTVQYSTVQYCAVSLYNTVLTVKANSKYRVLRPSLEVRDNCRLAR